MAAQESEHVNELDVAKAVRDGSLPSPQRYANVWLFDVRVTGTGMAYRGALDEYVYRAPENVLTDEFMERVAGLPVVFEHPDGMVLDGDEFRSRIVGTLILPYVKGEEVWAIARIYDPDAAKLMETTHCSTSPAVVFVHGDEAEHGKAKDGKNLLIEGVPSHLDHLAICREGVWDKGGKPSGINLN